MMNYISELNRFYHFCISKKLSKSEIALLHALYMINNAEDWTLWFEADNEFIQRLTGGYSRESINEARNKLKQKGRIDFKEGTRNVQSAKYRIISFDSNEGKSDMKVDKEVDIQVDKQVDKVVDIQVDTISKLNKTKQKRAKRAQTPPPVFSDRKAYGEFGKVLLTDTEYSKLAERYGEATVKQYIDQLDTYSKSTGKQYTDYYATILNWLRRDKVPERSSATTVDIDMSEALRLSEQQAEAERRMNLDG